MPICDITFIKTSVLERFHFFNTSLVSGGMVSGNILVFFCDIGCIFSNFVVSWRQAWNLIILQRYHMGTQVETTQPGGGDALVRGLQ